MLTTLLALLVANSPLAPTYFEALGTALGPFSLLLWINDGLMALFFLLVGLEIKREMKQGELATPQQRALPLVGAVGGMLVPALVYLLCAGGDPLLRRGWAIPAATDIAFALGVVALLGSRVPLALKTFLAALAIFDDMGAIVIIALFYSQGLVWSYLGLAVLLCGGLWLLNRAGVSRLVPYMGLGVLLWLALYKSGLHPTLSGVLLALSIPLTPSEGNSTQRQPPSPLHRLEGRLHGVIPFLVVPLFGFANAGISLEGLAPSVLWHGHGLGIVMGLLVGKVIGVFGFCWLAVVSGRARLPGEANWSQLLGVCFLCGIGFTMSIFISLLAFAGQEQLVGTAKLAVVVGSALSGVLGAALLWRASDSPDEPLEDAPI